MFSGKYSWLPCQAHNLTKYYKQIQGFCYYYHSARRAGAFFSSALDIHCASLLSCPQSNKEVSLTASYMLAEDVIHFILRLSIYYHWASSNAKVHPISTSLDIKLESGDMENRCKPARF